MIILYSDSGIPCTLLYARIRISPPDTAPAAPLAFAVAVKSSPRRLTFANQISNHTYKTHKHL